MIKCKMIFNLKTKYCKINQFTSYSIFVTQNANCSSQIEIAPSSGQYIKTKNYNCKKAKLIFMPND